MSLPIQGRPEFGNPAHIKALKDIEAQDAFKILAECQKCDGERECSKCDAECGDCDGTGKDWFLYKEWKEKFPGHWPDFK